MTQTYLQIQKRIEALRKQADKLRTKEVGGVVARIKVAIAHYGLTAEQLGLGKGDAGGQERTPRVARSASPARFADGNGNTWSGRGPRPQWLRSALAAGRSLEEFDVKGGSSDAAAAEAGKIKRRGAPAKAAKASKRVSKKAARRAAQTVRWRDGDNTWSGMGPKPRWFQEALAGGKTLDDLRAG